MILSSESLKQVSQVINIVDYLRIKAIKKHLNTDKETRFSPWQNKLLKMDFVKLSEAAYLCNLNYTAALFIEIGNDQKK